MKTMTDQLAGQQAAFEDALIRGMWAAAHGDKFGELKAARESCAKHRAMHGFQRVWAPLLTAPDENLKLAKGKVPSYGLTLQHYVVKTLTQGTLNLCPNAGDCTKVCVLNNGSGAYNTVQRARRWKTEFLANHPWAFFVQLGYEIQRAIMKHGEILVRPNVNSDIAWEQVVPALVDGSIFGNAVKFYGYTKLESVLDTDGWITPHYRVAYSWSERTGPKGHLSVRVAAFLARGGSVAMVTNRKTALGHRKAQTFEPRHAANWIGLFTSVRVMNADLTDEWIFQPSTIGDLAAKGKAEKLAGKSGFVVTCYPEPVKPTRVSVSTRKLVTA